MCQRKEQQQTTVRLHRDIRHGVDAGIGDEHEIGVGELNAFRRAGGTGGVHDGGEVRSFDRMFALLEFGVGHGMSVFDHRVDRTKSDDTKLFAADLASCELFFLLLGKLADVLLSVFACFSTIM